MTQPIDSPFAEINCPNCGHRFPLSDSFRGYFEEEKRRAVNNALRDREAGIRAEVEEANQAKLDERDEQVTALETQLQAEQQAHEKRQADIRAEIEKASQEQVEALQGELKEVTEAQERREKEIRDAALKDAEGKFALERQEFAIERERTGKTITELQSQIKQKAPELQGEALERHLKQQLQIEFPLDTLTDIDRGQRGADLVHQVNDRQLGPCGKLIWEVKRAKNWSNDWLDKIKRDSDEVGAHLRIIATQALPSGISTFAQKDGVWITNIECALPLASILRSSLIGVSRHSRSIQGQDEKLNMIYQYLTSPRFIDRIERIMDAWESMSTQIGKEQAAMQRQWKARRKDLDSVLSLTTDLYTDISHILGQEMPQVSSLELKALSPGDDGED